MVRNNVVMYTMFDVDKHHDLHNRVFAIMDAGEVLSELVAGKDYISECPEKEELWRVMRIALGSQLGVWKAQEEKTSHKKSSDALAPIARIARKVFKELEGKSDEPNHEPMAKPEPDYPLQEQQEEEPVTEVDLRPRCKGCKQPMEKTPDEKGIVTPHIRKKYRLGKYSVGRRYRLYRCRNCLMDNVRVSKTIHGFGIEVEHDWGKRDKELESIRSYGVRINGSHITYREAAFVTNEMRHKDWTVLNESEIFDTPIEIHVIRCCANEYAIDVAGAESSAGDVIKASSKWMRHYYRARGSEGRR